MVLATEAAILAHLTHQVPTSLRSPTSNRSLDQVGLHTLAGRLSRGPLPAALAALIGGQISQSSNTGTTTGRADAALHLLSYCTHRSLIGIRTTPPPRRFPSPTPWD